MQGFAHRLTCIDARGHDFDTGRKGRLNRTLAIDRLANRVHHAANEFRADGHFENAARRLDGVAFGDVLVLAQDHRADGVALQVQRQAERGDAFLGGREFQHFAGHRIGQAVDAADAVGHGDHRALVADVGGGRQALDPALDQFANLCGIELHVSFLVL